MTKETSSSRAPVAKNVAPRTPEATAHRAMDAYSEERDLMNQLLGQVQMARAVSKFADVVSLTKLAHVKETKIYRALAGKSGFDQDGNEIDDVGTWDGFCRAIGSSKTKVDEDLLNLRAFGEDAMQQLSSIGAGYRDLRKLRALPDDTRAGLLESHEAKQALASGDKDALRELIEDMAVWHAKAQEASAKKITELSADLAAKDKLLAADRKRIDMLASEVERVKSEPADERIAALRKDLAGVGFEIEALLLNKFLPVLQEINDHERAHGGDSAGPMLGAVRQVERTMAAVRAECGMPALQDDDLARV